MDLQQEVSRLERRRQASIATLDSIVAFVTNYVPSKSGAQRAIVRLDEMPHLYKRFDDTQSQLEEIDESNTISHISIRLAFREKYFDMVAELQSLVGDQDKLNKEEHKVEQFANSHCSMKLPAVTAPTFSGALQDWTSFIDAFNAMFHSNSSLADVQKFHYLKSCLSGSASDVVKTIPTTGDNYSRAYDTLVSRYENEGLIIQSHIRSLLDAPRVQVASAIELQALYHHVVAHVRALEALQQPVVHWDAWLVTLVCSRLDSFTAGEWQLRQVSRELPKYTDIESFLTKRILAYEAGETTVTTESKVRVPKQVMQRHPERRVLLANTELKQYNCKVCSEPHRLYQCEKFKDMSIADRKLVVSKNRLCFNCLSYGHQVFQCKYSHCKKCTKKHNTLLHDDNAAQGQSSATNDSLQQQSNNVVVMCAAYDHSKTQDTISLTQPHQVMLATVVFTIIDSQGIARSCRAVLDSGAQLSFMTQDFVERFKLCSDNTQIPIKGIGNLTTYTSGVVTTDIISRINEYETEVQFHVVKSITHALPASSLDIRNINIPTSLQGQLADLKWNQPSEVNALLGADVFYELFTGQRVKISNQSSLHNTMLGWIVTGKTFPTSYGHHENSVVVSPEHTSDSIALYSTKASRHLEEEELTENHFKSHTYRDSDGRFVVRLPSSKDVCMLGNSRYIAEKRFLNIERKLQRDKALADEYRAFMREYLHMGHMKLVNSSELPSTSTYYLPHHAVIKSDSITTKTRVVFDASATKTSGLSLNDIMMRGATVQPNLVSILLRFRTHSIVLTADVEKMYRQVKVHPSDCDLQRILYRDNPVKPLQEYQLLTVTYGTKSAPFLATRCLVELANSEEDATAKRSILQDFYVDDLMTGGLTVNECFKLYTSVSKTLMSAQMPLRKWCSNSPELLSKIPMQKVDPHYVLMLTDRDTISTLGVMWQPSTDSFLFKMRPWYPPAQVTKRSMLSDINRVYDPVGFITPILITGKIFVQQLWTLKLDWDAIPPKDVQQKWSTYYQSLSALNSLQIPRSVVAGELSSIQLHGFSDASQEAFGACVYVRTATSSNTWETRLYASKSRVAPIHPTTIPRLELCAAVLLTELMNEINIELNKLGIVVGPECMSYWSDSSIVVAWIHSQQLLKTYVANRVAQIHDHTIKEQWRHVSTTCNPADLISRGVPVESLQHSELWWNGPQWLNKVECTWPQGSIVTTDVPEVRTVKLVLTAAHEVSNPLLERQSSWLPLIRITAWILRFAHNTKTSASHEKINGPLTVKELQAAQLVWFRIAQRADFPRELHDLQQTRQVARKSCLRTLNPFIDVDGLIHVGGRMTATSLSYTIKHPIVIHSRHKITRLFFKYEHERLLHVGPQALLAQMHRFCWPIRGKALAKTIVHNCITCYRFSPKLQTPLMAPLPKERVKIERPFFRSGVDFCGPVHIKSGIRRVKSIKCYIAVFICFVTRAVHLELVTDMTSNAFLAALTRFMSRRGTCSHIHSDNGTNFVGANKELRNYFQTSNATQAVNDTLANHGVQWHFNPPSAPHFGGLWEAAVKSAKHHLLKATKSALLTFEEMSTLLCRVEAILNSRPMTSISSSPSDLEALTPSHFLTGGPAILPQEPDVSTIPINRLRRFELMRAQIQTFWKRWSLEYTPQLQKRGRWTSISRNVEVGDLAILQEDNLPSLQWKLVRIVATHPGKDNVVRVVTVKLSTGTELKRPVTKLALLPNPDEHIEEEDNHMLG